MGLVDLFCAVSNGRVNINTAPEAVLEIILRGDATTAHHIQQIRAGADGMDGTADDEPARNDADITRDASLAALTGRIRLFEGSGRSADDVVSELWRRFFGAAAATPAPGAPGGKDVAR